jgi:hypothetical protein
MVPRRARIILSAARREWKVNAIFHDLRDPGALEDLLTLPDKTWQGF